MGTKLSRMEIMFIHLSTDRKKQNEPESMGAE